jgi:hypothetical protein
MNFYFPNVLVLFDCLCFSFW